MRPFTYAPEMMARDVTFESGLTLNVILYELFGTLPDEDYAALSGGTFPDERGLCFR